MNEEVPVPLALAVAFLLSACAGIIAWGLTANHWRQEAINHGAAVWTINAKTGERAFTWTTKPNPEASDE